MITLYQFEPAFGLPNASPFCMKIETYLRMVQLPYQAPLASMGDFGKAPKGKMPFIDDGGTLVADSSFIIDYLKQTYGDALDAWLNPKERSMALAYQRLLEENLYWAMVYVRWVEPVGWKHTRQAFFGNMPVPLRWIVPPFARRGILRQLRGHGLGRHSAAEIYTIGKHDITALAEFLDDKPYFLGDKPCSLDAVAYAFLANLLWVPVDSPLKLHAQNYVQLESYCQRMRGQYYPK